MTTKAMTEILRREQLVLKAARRYAELGLSEPTPEGLERFQRAEARLTVAAIKLAQAEKRAPKARKR